MGAPLALLASMATGLIPKIAPIAARAGSGLLTRAAAAARPVVAQTAQVVRNEGLGDLAARAGRKVNQYLSPGSGSEYGIRPVETGKYTPSASGEYGIRPAEGRETGFRSFAQPSQQPRSQAPSEPNAPAKNDRSTFQRLANLVQQSLRQRSQGVATAADGAPASPLTDVQRAERRAGYKEQYGDIIGGGMADEADSADAERARKEQDERIEKSAMAMATLATAGSAAAGSLLAAGVASKQFADTQLRSQEGLKRYSGGIARAFAELERSDMQRQYQMASGTERSTKMLADAINDMRTQLHPLQQQLANTLNVLATIAAKLVAIWAWLQTKTAELGLNPIVQLLQNIDRGIANGNAKTTGVWNQALRDMANGKFNTVRWGQAPNGQKGRNQRERQDERD
jgi:hypothetical protein